MIIVIILKNLTDEILLTFKKRAYFYLKGWERTCSAPGATDVNVRLPSDDYHVCPLSHKKLKNGLPGEHK